MSQRVRASRLRFTVALLACSGVLPIASATSPASDPPRVEPHPTHAEKAGAVPAHKVAGPVARSVHADNLSAHVDEGMLVRQASLSGVSSLDAKGGRARMNDFQQVPIYQEARGLNLPEPNGWSALLATLALAGFFFIRRIK